MYNNILVPLDGSKLAEGTIPFVNEIILGGKESRKIEVTLLQVVPSKHEMPIQGGLVAGVVVNVSAPYTDAEQDEIKKSVAVYLNKIGETLRNDPMVTIKTVVKFGEDPADQILKASDELKIDLIVISTHGRSGISRWAFGSVADKILRGGTTPVFMVRSAK